MRQLSALLLGFIITAATTLLPGLVNMNVAKISLTEGKSRALSFAAGASLIVYCQAYIGTLFARFIDKRTDISNTIQEVGIFIFLLFSIYFFWSASRKKKTNTQVKISSKKSVFVNGMLLSAANLFPIPFYVILSITLFSYGYFSFERSFLLLYALGSALGGMFIFYLYTIYIKQLEHRTDFILKHINTLLGCITLVVAVIGLIKRISQ